MNIIFLDTEATGLDDARMIQLAYKNRGDTGIFVEYYKPPVPIEFEAMGVHHITQKMVDDKLPFSETQTSKDLPLLLEESILVAHNAPFDIGILKSEGVKTQKYICTYKVAYSMYELPNYKMQSLRYRWGIEIADAVAHDAKGDVLVLEEVFDYMIKDYCKIHSISEDEAVQKFIDISMNPLLLRTLTFGKAQGKTFEEIWRTDFSYLQWLGTLGDKDEDFKFTVNYYLNKKQGSEEVKQPDSSLPF